MRYRMVVGVVAGLACVAPLRSKAQGSLPLTGSFMLQGCESSVAGLQQTCEIYLRGVYEGMVWGQQLVPYGTLVCPQAHVSTTQLRLLFIQAAHQDPQLLNQDAATLSAKGILNAFRCKPGQKPVYGK